MNRRRERTRKSDSAKCKKNQKNMKVIESYGKYAVEGCKDISTGLHSLVISDFPSISYAIFIQPNERA